MPGEIVFAALTPATPELMVERHAPSDERAGITSALRTVSRELADAKPDVVLYVAPPGSARQGALGLCAAPVLTATTVLETATFDDTAQTDFQLQQLLALHCQEAGLQLAVVDRYRLYPLHMSVMMLRQFFADAGLPDLPLVVTTFAERSYAYHLNVGHAMTHAIARSGRRVALIVAVDLPARSEGTEVADEPLAQAFTLEDWAALEPPQAPEGATVADPERAMALLTGVLGDYDVRPTLLHYAPRPQASWLVGTLAAKKLPDPLTAPQRPVRPAADLAALAMEAIRCFSARGDVVRANDKLMAQYGRRRAAVVIQLYRNGEALAERGTIVPCHDDLCDEVIQAAVAAAEFAGPFKAADLRQLTARVTVIGDLEPVQDLTQVDPRQYGLLITTGTRTALTLPDYTGSASPERQMAETKAKIGLMPDEPAWTYRFAVETYASWADAAGTPGKGAPVPGGR